MRLIDADGLKERLKEYCIDGDKGIEEIYEIMGIDDCIDNAPTIDAFEVVRCKDCKFAQNNRYNSRVDGKCSVLCEHITTEDGRYELKVFRSANDFCSYGKRREND